MASTCLKNLTLELAPPHQPVFRFPKGYLSFRETFKARKNFLTDTQHGTALSIAIHPLYRIEVLHQFGQMFMGFVDCRGTFCLWPTAINRRGYLQVNGGGGRGGLNRNSRQEHSPCETSGVRSRRTSTWSLTSIRLQCSNSVRRSLLSISTNYTSSHRLSASMRPYTFVSNNILTFPPVGASQTHMFTTNDFNSIHRSIILDPGQSQRGVSNQRRIIVAR